MMTFKEWRLGAGWTQARVARELERHGAGKVSPQSVSNWEKGVQPSAVAYEAIRRLTKGKVPAASFAPPEKVAG